LHTTHYCYYSLLLGFTFPGLPSGKSQIDLFWTCVDTNPGPIFAAIIFIGIVEAFSGIATVEGRKSGDRAPGDWGFDPLKFSKDEKTN
jgi:light-harvesting complex I chlorophyll a/b binding protein 1